MDARVCEGAGMVAVDGGYPLGNQSQWSWIRPVCRYARKSE